MVAATAAVPEVNFLRFDWSIITINQCAVVHSLWIYLNNTHEMAQKCNLRSINELYENNTVRENANILLTVFESIKSANTRV